MSQHRHRPSQTALHLEHLEQREVPATLAGASVDFNPIPQALGSTGGRQADRGSPGEVRVIPDAGHDLQADQPPAVATAIKGVLKRTEVSGILADVAAKYGIPGLSAAVIVDGKVITGTAGVKRAGGTSPVATADAFQNGSTTKAMTATLAGALVDRGVLKWKSTLGELFPELAGKIRPEYLGTTLEQLLQHRSGLISDDQVSPALQQAYLSATGDPTANRLRLLPLLLNEPLANPVGQFNYSNAGFYLAATVMERVTGRSYERLMDQYLFRPLGIATATFARPAENSDAVKGHDDAGKPVPESSDLYKLFENPISNPAGANLRMTAADWAKFIRVHLGETVNRTRLLKPETLARLHRPAFAEIPGGGGQNTADGWFVRPAGFNGNNPELGSSLWHNGSDNLWYAEVEGFPDARFATLVMANTAITKGGNDIGTTAVAEIQTRLRARFAPNPKPAVESPSEAVRQALAPIRSAFGVPAVAAGVVADGRATFAAVGVREVGASPAVSDFDRFHLGSNGKSMTASLAVVLVERGTIRWNSTVADVFPELRGSIRKEYLGVTLEELVNNRSGLADIVTAADVGRYTTAQRAARFGSEGRQMFLRDWLKNVAPANARGAYNYSNVGFTLAGMMLERAAGRGFEWLLRENLFQPLGMTTADFGFPTSNGARGQPLGHDATGKPIRIASRELPDILSPAGGVPMSMADWSKYLRVHLGEKVNGVRLLSAASLTKLHTPDAREATDETGTFRYGFGWRAVQTPLGEALGSEGAVPGFYSRVGIIPSKGIAVFSAVNQLGEASQPANEAVTTALLSRVPVR